MSVHEHHARAPSSARCFVLTVSDTRTLETDVSGQTLLSLLTEAGHTVVGHTIVRDEKPAIVAALEEALRRPGVDAVLCTGGTGIAQRDVTIEAASGLIDKEIPGFGELFRMLSFEEIGPAAMLSRATAGVARGCLLFVCPGSTGAVRLAMSRLILPELGHLVREMRRAR